MFFPGNVAEFFNYTILNKNIADKFSKLSKDRCFYKMF